MTEDTSRWIEIPNWEVFQHYKDRNPDWIKLHAEWVDHEAFSDLNFSQRGLLVQLWMLAAKMGNGRVPGRGQTLARHLLVTNDADARYLRRHLEVLNHHGLIVFRASKAPAERKHRASPEVLLRKTKRGAAQTASADAPLLENGRRPITAERAAELARINREEMGGPA